MLRFLGVRATTSFQAKLRTSTQNFLNLVVLKLREGYTSVMTYIRTKLRFALLRSTIAVIRGFRGKRSDVHLQDLTDINFSLIPSPQSCKAEE